MKLKIKGKLENCENCAIGKMRQKNVPKGPKEKSTKPGYIDIMSSKYTSAGGSKYWCLAVDEATHMKFSMFLKQKSGMKAIFVGYAEKHAGNVYRFINPSTDKIVLSVT